MPPTVLELLLLPLPDIAEDDVAAAVDAFLTDPALDDVPLGAGRRINPAAAVAAHPFARALIGQPWASVELRRAAVRAAILLARLERPAAGGCDRSHE